MENNTPETSILVKLSIYLGGLVIGMAAKFAQLKEEKKLTVNKMVLHAALALSSGWVVGWVLYASGKGNWALWISPLIGHFGDWMILAIWKIVREKILNIVKSNGTE